MDRHRFLMSAVGAAVLAAALGQYAPASAQPAHKEELSESYRGSQRNNVAYQKIAPFKLFDNLFYVGPGYVSVWLIPTSGGLILIDSAQEPYVDHVIDGIRKEGFDPKDIKYLILTHGHLDHFGGAARIRQLSGARVVALDEDWTMMEHFTPKPPKPGQAPDAAPKRDMVVKDGDTLTLGGETLAFYKLPGHTPGSLSFAFTVYDRGKPYKAFLFGGPGPRGGLPGAEQFLASVDRLATIPGIQVGVLIHSWLNDYHYPNGGIPEREERMKTRKPGDPNPFVDPQSWREWMTELHAGAVKHLTEEKAKAGQ
jgi:metallo-beta-lactamase class B